MKTSAVVVTYDFGECKGMDIRTKDGAMERVVRERCEPRSLWIWPAGHTAQASHR